MLDFITTLGLFCLGALILGLFGAGFYFLFRKAPQEKPAPPTGPLPYSGSAILAEPKPRGLLSRPIDWIALAVIIILLSAWIIPMITGASYQAPSSIHKITYQIRGSVTGASVTLTNAQGGTEQHDRQLPVRMTYDMDYLSSASLLAQKQGEAGSIICEIYDGDKLWLSSTSTAPYGICTCAGVVGFEMISAWPDNRPTSNQISHL